LTIPSTFTTPLRALWPCLKHSTQGRPQSVACRLLATCLSFLLILILSSVFLCFYYSTRTRNSSDPKDPDSAFPELPVADCGLTMKTY
jgi:hypothetical protein